MKHVFYKRLLAEKHSLSANERIIYSFLVYNSICNCEDVWDKETGKFDDSILNEIEYIELPNSISNESGLLCTQIANDLNINKSTVSRTCKKLKSLGILKQKTIQHQSIYKNGYFDLDCDTLNGELLIFYCWLKDLKGENQFIYTNREKLSKMYHMEISDIRWYLHRLKELGFVERQNDGKLLIK